MGEKRKNREEAEGRAIILSASCMARSAQGLDGSQGLAWADPGLGSGAGACPLRVCEQLHVTTDLGLAWQWPCGYCASVPHQTSWDHQLSIA